MAAPTIASLRDVVRGQVVEPNDPDNVFRMNQNVRPVSR